MPSVTARTFVNSRNTLVEVTSYEAVSYLQLSFSFESLTLPLLIRAMTNIIISSHNKNWICIPITCSVQIRHNGAMTSIIISSHHKNSMCVRIACSIQIRYNGRNCQHRGVDRFHKNFALDKADFHNNHGQTCQYFFLDFDSRSY